MTAFQSEMEVQRKRLSEGGQAKQKQGGYKKNNFASSPRAQGVATSPAGNAMAVGTVVQRSLGRPSSKSPQATSSLRPRHLQVREGLASIATNLDTTRVLVHIQRNSRVFSIQFNPMVMVSRPISRKNPGFS